MRAMILAAGRGERLLPYTRHTPKPLLAAGGQSLIEYHIHALVAAGMRDIVINVSHLSEQIMSALGDGRDYQATLTYSEEAAPGLETGGGVFNALALLGEAPFVVVNADIWTDYDFSRLPSSPSGLAHLVMVDNPVFHPKGDFALTGSHLKAVGDQRLTFSGIGVYSPGLFDGCQAGRFPLAPLLIDAMECGQVSGEHHQGEWMDIGAPERWAALMTRLDNAGQ